MYLCKSFSPHFGIILGISSTKQWIWSKMIRSSYIERAETARKEHEMICWRFVSGLAPQHIRRQWPCLAPDRWSLQPWHMEIPKFRTLGYDSGHLLARSFGHQNDSSGWITMDQFWYFRTTPQNRQRTCHWNTAQQATPTRMSSLLRILKGFGVLPLAQTCHTC